MNGVTGTYAMRFRKATVASLTTVGCVMGPMWPSPSNSKTCTFGNTGIKTSATARAGMGDADPSMYNIGHVNCENALSGVESLFSANPQRATSRMANKIASLGRSGV